MCLNNSMHYDIEKKLDDSFIIIKTQGIATVAQDFINCLELILSNPAWKPSMNILINHQELETQQVDIEEIKKLSMQSLQFIGKFGDAKIATVTSNNSAFAKAQIFELLTEDKISITIKVFRDLIKAKEWLKE